MMPVTAHDLLSLVRSQDYEALDRAWQDETSQPGDVHVYVRALDALCEQDGLGLALKLAQPMVSALESGGRARDAIALGNAVVKNRAHNEEFARSLFGLVENEFGSAEWFAIALELSGLSATTLDPDAFVRFDRIRRYTAGNVIYHRGGWDEGIVEELDSVTRELTVRFVSGRTQQFPLESALDSLRPLDPGDLRAMRLTGVDELARLVEEDPAVLIRKAAQIYRGTITSTQVKNELSPSVIPTKKWASFWKRAKNAAANDPWLEITGSKTRPVFELRKKPLSLADEARRAVNHTTDIGEAIAVIRQFIERSTDEAARATLLDIAQETLEAALQKEESSPAHILDGILLLEDNDRHLTVSAAEELKVMLIHEEAGLDPSEFDKLATQEAREHAVRLLPEALGEDWWKLCIEKLTVFPTTVVEDTVALLQTSNRGGELAPLWNQIAPYPRRHPVLTYLLGRLYAEGAFDGREDKPELISVGRVLLHLARIITADRKGNPTLNRLRTRVTSLLTGRRALLAQCLEVADRDIFAAYLGIVERGGADFPQEIADAVFRAVARAHPDLTQKPEKPFWERDERIFVTKQGLERQQEEYRVLVDEKIPANSKAIGAAASLGDLSENSEWEAAMEEQRNLTARADTMDRDLKRARLLEDQEIPSDVVAPGTKLSYTLLDTGEQTTLTILGPWDCDEADDSKLNYRAPLAKFFLGRRAGEESEMKTPEGQVAFRVDSVERVI